MANVPEDILKQVFNLAAGFMVYNYENWTKQLVLLSVCQRWRQCALPLVCYHAGFDFKGPVKKYMNLKSIESTLVTNIDKFMTIGHPDLVRHLDIRVDCNKNMFACIKLVLDKLSGYSPVWRSMREVCIELLPIFPDTNNAADEAFAYVQIGEAAVDRMAKMLPNIVKLQFQDFFNKELSKMFNGRLADVYAPNLKHLIAYKPIPLDNLNVFSKLTNLQIGCDNNPSISLPLAQIDTLKCLKLEYLPPSLQWYNIAQTQGNKVVFSSLRTLELRYIPPSDNSSINANTVDTVDTPELHFPKLKFLTIVNPPDNQLLLSRSVFDSELEKVHIHADIAYIKQLTYIKLLNINRLSLYARHTNHGSIGSALHTLSKVAKNGHTIDCMRVLIKKHASMDLTGCTAFPPISHLHILNIPNYKQVFSLVQRLPCLKDLGLYSVNTDNINLDELETLLNNQQAVSPISSSVEQVSVTYSDILSSHTVVGFTTLLLVGLPALKKLKAMQLDKSVLLVNVYEYKAHYPHLENVQINISY